MNNNHWFDTLISHQHNWLPYPFASTRGCKLFCIGNGLFPNTTLVLEYGYQSGLHNFWRPTDPHRPFCCICSNSLCSQTITTTWDNHIDPHIIPFVNFILTWKLEHFNCGGIGICSRVAIEP